MTSQKNPNSSELTDYLLERTKELSDQLFISRQLLLNFLDMIRNAGHPYLEETTNKEIEKIDDLLKDPQWIEHLVK